MGRIRLPAGHAPPSGPESGTAPLSTTLVLATSLHEKDRIRHRRVVPLVTVVVDLDSEWLEGAIRSAVTLGPVYTGLLAECHTLRQFVSSPPKRLGRSRSLLLIYCGSTTTSAWLLPSPLMMIAPLSSTKNLAPRNFAIWLISDAGTGIIKLVEIS
jgi:hypothetical protein